MSLKSLIATGTKLWLDSIDPELVKKNRAAGATGATSNPIIISNLIKTGRFDADLQAFIQQDLSDEDIAWALTNKLVTQAQDVFRPVWEQTKGNDGYVSFELDPLLEDVKAPIPHQQKVERYIALAKKWSANQTNRMIKIPATQAGLDAMEAVAAAGVTINVTLIFSQRQYRVARDNIWRGAQARGTNGGGVKALKSVYSIFVSRVDVYTEKHVPTLLPEAQGMVGILNAKRMWRENQGFWKDKNLPMLQEIIFASTGTKNPGDPADKYVEALAGSDIQTNPPATNDAVEKLNKTYTRQVDIMPSKALMADIDAKVDQQKMEDTLMQEGTLKFADPQHALLKLITEKRTALAAAK